MPAPFEVMNPGAAAYFRARLFGRSHYCLGLGAREVSALVSEAGLRDNLIALVDLLAPAAAHDPDSAVPGSLTGAEFATFVGRLCLRGNGATIPQQITLVQDLHTAGLTRQQLLAIVTTLANDGAGALTGQHLCTLIHNLRHGGIPLAPDRVLAMVNALCGAGVPAADRLTPEQFKFVVETVHPEPGVHSGARVWQTLELLCTGDHRITPRQIHRLMELFRPTGAAAADVPNGRRIGTLIDSLVRPEGGAVALHARQVFDILENLMGAAPGRINGVQAADVVQRLRVSLPPASVHGLVGRMITVPGFGEAKIRPLFIHALSGRAHADGRLFAALFQGCIGASTLTSAAEMLRALDSHGYPVANICTLLAQLPNVRAPRAEKWMRFLGMGGYGAGSGGRWSTAIVTHLESFFTDGHAPFGANGPSPNTAFAFEPDEFSRLIGHYRFHFSGGALNYFCNAHTYRHLDFRERVRRRPAFVEMFPSTSTTATVRTDLIAQLSLEGMQTYAAQMSRGGSYGYQTLGGRREVGLTYDRREGHYSVTHFSPVSGLRMSLDALLAIAVLFE